MADQADSPDRGSFTREQLRVAGIYLGSIGWASALDGETREPVTAVFERVADDFRRLDPDVLAFKDQAAVEAAGIVAAAAARTMRGLPEALDRIEKL